MACDSWKAKLDTYLDGEFSSEEMRAFDVHVRSCSSCAADTLTRLQMKRSIQTAGRRFTPAAAFREQVRRSIATKPHRNLSLRWVLAPALLGLILTGFLSIYFVVQRSGVNQVYSEIADLHVAALASSSRVDVVSSDRHSVKPWFQGKIPFTFDLPDLQNSDFSLVGGRMTYLEQTPGAHLIYQLRKHEISVFIFQEAALQAKTDERSAVTKKVSFNIETWSQGGLRYFVVGDAGESDINKLAELFKQAAAS